MLLFQSVMHFRLYYHTHTHICNYCNEIGWHKNKKASGVYSLCSNVRKFCYIVFRTSKKKQTFHMRIAQNRDRLSAFRRTSTQMQRQCELYKPIKSDLLFFVKYFKKQFVLSILDKILLFSNRILFVSACRY